MLLSTCEIMGVVGKGLCGGRGEGGVRVNMAQGHDFFLSFKRRFTSL